MSPFDILKAINETKESIITDQNEHEYNAFMVNKGLSFFKDTVLYANEINLYGKLDNKMQFDYYLNAIKKAKRFSKWFKLEKNDEIDAIQEHYQCNYTRAREISKFLTKEQIKRIVSLK